MKTLVLLSAIVLSVSLYAACPGGHDFEILEQQDMQFVDSYLNRFQPRMSCKAALNSYQATKAAKTIMATYKECTLSSEPDVDYHQIVSKIGNDTYQLCKSDSHFQVDPWSWNKITVLMPTNGDSGYNVSFIQIWQE